MSLILLSDAVAKNNLVIKCRRCPIFLHLESLRSCANYLFDAAFCALSNCKPLQIVCRKLHRHGLCHLQKYIKYIYIYNTYFKLPEWILKWFCKLVNLLKPLWQMSHRNGQKPLCVYMWDLRSPGVGKDLGQKLHLCGFTCNSCWINKL